jgi:hypothetical protein
MVALLRSLIANEFIRSVTLARTRNAFLADELTRQVMARVFHRHYDRAICQEWQILEARHGTIGGASGQCRMPYRRGSFGEVGDDGGDFAFPLQISELSWSTSAGSVPCQAATPIFQTHINAALHEYINARTEPLEMIIRRVIREELKGVS